MAHPRQESEESVEKDLEEIKGSLRMMQLQETVIGFVPDGNPQCE